MRTRWLAGGSLRAPAASLVIAAALSGLGPGAASASTCVSWTGLQPPSPGSTLNELAGVAVVSSCRAWAVGTYSNPGTGDLTLIERWNGFSWTQVPSPNPSSSVNVLFGVAATSPTNAWAVGDYAIGGADQTLVEHWNGTRWKRVFSPSPGGSHGNGLEGVAATSPTNAWAVGTYNNGTAEQTLVERWNGTRWKHVPSPNPGGPTHANFLSGVAATSSTNAWAVGSYFNGTSFQTLVERWNGTRWKHVPSPTPEGSKDNVLFGVAATSSINAWAVGDYFNGTSHSQTLVERWNGTRWKRVPSPSPGGPTHANFLSGVAATSSTNAWAVGSYFNGTSFQTLVERWNGTRWKHVPSPNP